jgi:hypothetical protein
MSQNILQTSSAVGQVRITAGWDKPLSEIFCNVLCLDDVPDDNIPGCVLENRYESVDDICTSLKAADIELPDQMLEALRRDVETEAGNVIRVFRRDGSLEHETDLRDAWRERP